VSYASYRVAALAEELIQYEPDLFIVYSGHNEFLERRTYAGIIETPQAVTDIAAILSRTRIFTAGRDLLFSGRNQPARTRKAGPVLAAEVDTILDHSFGPRDYTRDDELKAQVEAHYRFNLQRIIDIARAGGADVILVTPAANLGDCSPFKSEHSPGLSDEEKRRSESLLTKGMEARRRGELDKAVELLSEAGELDPRYAEVSYELGLALRDLGRYQKAKQALQRALDEDVCPLRILSGMQTAVATVAKENQVPLIDFARVIDDRSAHGIPGSEFFLDHVHLKLKGYRLLALDILRELEDMGVVQPAPSWDEKAIETASAKVESRVDRHAEGEALRNLAKVFDWAGKHDEAAQLAKQAVQALGDDAESLYIEGHTALAGGDVDGAIRLYRKALRIQPGYLEPHYSLGVALLSRGKTSEAVGQFEKVLELKPDHHEARINLSTALLSLGRAEEAVATLREAARISPNSADVMYNLGVAMQAAGHVDEAMEKYRETIRLDPSRAGAERNLGILLAMRGDAGPAARHLERSIELDPNSPEAHDNLGKLLATTGQLREAVKHFRQALAIDPKFHKSQYNLGLALSMLGRSEEALPHFQEAVRLQPENPAAWAWLAWILATDPDAKIRSQGDAVAMAERAARMTRGQDPTVMDALAAAYADQGRFAEAQRAAQAAQKQFAAANATKLADQVGQRLQLYRRSKPYRETSRGGDATP